MELNNTTVAVAALVLGLGSFASAVSIYRHMTRKIPSAKPLAEPPDETPAAEPPPRPGFFARGGAWVLGQVALIGLLVVSPLFPHPATWAWAPAFHFPGNLLATVFTLPGLFFLVTGFSGLGSNLTALPMPKDGGHHVATGIYRFIRHPIYSGLLATTLAWALLWNQVIPLLAFLPLPVLLHFKSRAEEAWLTKTYPGYAAYRARTKALIPWVL